MKTKKKFAKIGRYNIKTIDITALEWFDRVNGNSYFAGEIIINYDLQGYKKIIMNFQYGYGSQYESEALKELQKVCKQAKTFEGCLWRFCDEHNIIKRSTKLDNQRKKDLIHFMR